MKILLVNPNTTGAMTDSLSAVAQAHTQPGTEIVTVTAERGVPYIANRAEAQIAGAQVLELVAANRDGVDAVIIGAFGDPGLPAARELFDIPVIGMAEAAMLTACMLGDRFSIVTFSVTLKRWYLDCVAMYRLDGRCAGVRVPGVGFQSIAAVQHELEDDLVELANDAVANDDADSVLLAGAPLAGLAFRVAGRIPVPAVDPIAAAVRQAETLVGLGASQTLTGRAHRPPAKPTVGLDPNLADLIEHRDRPVGAR